MVFGTETIVALVVLGALFLILTTVALDRALHTSYVIADRKLTIKQGRMAKTKCIDIAEIAEYANSHWLPPWQLRADRT